MAFSKQRLNVNNFYCRFVVADAVVVIAVAVADWNPGPMIMLMAFAGWVIVWSLAALRSDKVLHTSTEGDDASSICDSDGRQNVVVRAEVEVEVGLLIVYYACRMWHDKCCHVARKPNADYI